MVKPLDSQISDKAQAKGYPELAAALKGMKENDVQTVLSFLINELAELTVRVASLEKKDDKINP